MVEVADTLSGCDRLFGRFAEKIFFFHNPKGGGTSINAVLARNFAAQDISPIIENCVEDHEDIGGEYSLFRGYCFYSGHYGRDIFKEVNDGHVAVTNFRHPVSRACSLYRYFRYSVQLTDDELNKERFYAVKFAKNHSLEEFICCEDYRVAIYINNYHFRQLSSSGWSMSEIALDDVQDVLDFIGAMKWFYVCEMPELSLSWYNDICIEKIESIPIENASTEAIAHNWVDDIDKNTVLKFIENNKYDMIIYDYSVNLLIQRCNPL